MVIWIIGLSGAGKTTIGQRLYERIKEVQKNTVFIDGDIFRRFISQDLDFSVKHRQINAMRQFNFCRLLDAQGINVICCILSNQRKLEEIKRQQFGQYYEIFIDVPMETLISRDPKGLYKDALDGKTKNVVGVDIEFVPPPNPDMVIDNTEFVDVDKAVDNILENLPQLSCDYLSKI